ncbi:MAG TPA: tubulin-like doman-containing protein [Gemmataceae bacterium]|nr:tubulin-like doman-containing protein [Gemmataceae bacterium]
MRIESGSEPIPGYRLIERLGGGGFGEVWKAEVPGGLFKAMKFVFGDLQGIDEDGSRAEQELKALSRVKTVHHPYILSLERYDIVNGQLIIVMELADRTLWDRFRECRLQGLPGIPRDELLNYVQETAEALDLMNNQFQLQHLDIKPQNLFLVFNHVKVADFGLVKDLGNMAAATITGGVTPVYAAPETFDGWLSRFSDQYSLAIVYQELLTGVRPFQGSTMRQLVMQHLQSPPDVGALPVNDRPPILRALSKNPDERFPTCLDLCQALRNGVAKAFPKAPTIPGEVREPAPTAPTAPNPSNAPLHPISAVEITWQARKGQLSSADFASPVPEDGSSQSMLLSGLAQQTPSEAPSRHSSVSLPASRLVVPVRPPKAAPELRAAPAVAAVPDRPATDEAEHRGVLQPTLFLGLGQLGIETMQAFRRILSTEFGHFELVPHIRFLAFDTDGDTLKAAGAGDERMMLRPSEMILAKLQRANHYLAKLRGETKWPTEEWLNGKLLYRIPRDNAKAPVRQLARFALANSLPSIARRIETELQAVTSDETVHEPSRVTDLGTRTGVPRVVVIANLAGATGGGTFLDIAYLVRSQLRRMNLAHAEVVGVFYLPPTGRDGIRSAALANAYTSLTELEYYQRRDGMSASFRSFDNKEMPRLDELGPPFHRCFFLDLPELAGTEAPATPPAVAEAAQFLYRDLITPLGKTLDKLRVKRRPGTAQKMALLRFGIHRRSWPRRELVQRLAEKFTVRLVERWKSKNAQAFAAEIQPWTLQQWEAMEMRPENLIARHQDRLERALGSAPDKQFQEILTPLTNLMLANKGASVNSTPFLAAMDRIEKVVGIPELSRDISNRNVEPGTMEQALKDISSEIGDLCDTRLAELIVALIEAPQFRLAGAEEAVRRFGIVVEDALKIQEGLAKELSERAAALYKRIHEIFDRIDKVDDKSSSGSTWFSRKTTSTSKTGTDVLDLLRVYSKTQYQALLLTAINRLYIGVRGHLSDQLREIGFCRTRLEELAGLIRERRTLVSSGPAKFEQFLLPTDAPTLDELVATFEKKLTEEEIVGFDELIQTHIRKQYRALLNVCLGPAAVVRTLAPVMLAEAEVYLDERFPAPNIVDLLGETEGGLIGAVSEMFDEAAPEAKRLDPEKEVAVASIPGDDSGMILATSFAKALPATTLLSSDRGEEILIYREQALSGFGELEQMGPVAQEAYRQKQTADPSSLHSRDDIHDWNSRPLAVGT